METATGDQFVAPVRVSDIVTVGVAPAAVEPTPRISKPVVPPDVTFHREVCPATTAALTFLPMTSVSMTMSPAALVTVTGDGDTAPSAKADARIGRIWSTPVNVVAPTTA